jgi:hypothetical protein
MNFVSQCKSASFGALLQHRANNRVLQLSYIGAGLIISLDTAYDDTTDFDC